MRELNITRSTKSNIKIASVQKRSKVVTLMDHLEIIIEEAENSKLSEEFLQKVKDHTDYVGQVMGISNMQVVLFALFVEQSSGSRIQISDFTRLLGCRTIKLIALMSDIDELEHRRIVRCRKEDNRIYYRVPFAVLEAVKNNQKIEFENKVNLNIEQFFESMAELMEERSNNELKEDSLLHELDDLVKNNPQLLFTQEITDYNIIDSRERLLFYAICHRFVNENDDHVGWHDFEDLYDKKLLGELLHGCISDGITYLQENKLIEFCNSDGFADREFFHLSEKAKNKLFAEINIRVKSERSICKELLRFEDILDKVLYYNPTETQQIDTLFTLLEEETFRNVQQRLVQSGMRKGFACLFYGSPGTGKTETVYQLAKHTGRDIMLVNVSEIKNMWVGESEKNMKALFDRYRILAKDSKLAPILLFNEADAIIGIRQEKPGKSVDKMENSIQNIILQEIENLEGIMIATTNLTQNLDKAFERRFLYKIEFSNPGAEVKQSIWQTMIPSLYPDWARDLSITYEFSGGQIENVARKQAVEQIIHGSELSLNMLQTFCDEELLCKKKTYKRIGF